MPVNAVRTLPSSEAPAPADPLTAEVPPAKTLALAEAVPTKHLDDDRRLLNQFMQQQVAMLNQLREQLLSETRESLLTEKMHLAQKLDEREQELERQERLLSVRVQELQKREARLSELDDAIPERVADETVPDSLLVGEGESTGRLEKTPVVEVEALRRQMAKLEEKLVELTATHNAARAELSLLADQ